jgi:hypothetical protein
MDRETNLNHLYQNKDKDYKNIVGTNNCNQIAQS